MDPLLNELARWVILFIVLSLWSLHLWKDNLIYRLVMHMGMGVAAGNTFLVALRYLQDSMFTPLVKGDLILVIPIIFGILFFARLTKVSWLSRYPSALLIGVSTGLAIRGMLTANVVIPLRYIITGGSRDPFNIVINIVFLVLVTVYFFYIKEQKGAIGYTARMARYTLMAVFGAQFATGLSTRYTWLYGPIGFILEKFGIIS